LIRQGSLAGLILVVLLSMARAWFQMSLSTYLPVWVESQGQTLAFASQVLFAFSISISLGSLVGGVLSDWIGQWQVLVLGSVFLVIGYWLFLGSSDVGQVILVGLMGVMIGSSYPVAILLAQEVWPQGVGLASALVMGIGWAPGGLGASVTGLIADRLSLVAGLQTLILAPILWLGCMLIFGFIQRRTAKNRPLDVEVV
jgi:predicted MFS family arabinose efflux permease